MTRAAVATAGLSVLAALRVSAAAAAPCTVLKYTFQPDCFRSAGDAACGFDPSHPDLGPQIAVWLESADATQFVDTLMVTNAVAIHGIGNRPGTWDLLSGPRFPYGRRQMAPAHLGPRARAAVPFRGHERRNGGRAREPREHLLARAVLLPAHGAGRDRGCGDLPERPVPKRQGSARHDAAAVVLPASRRPLQFRRHALPGADRVPRLVRPG